MLELLLLLVGIRYFLRKRSLRHFKSQQMPPNDTEKYDQWYAAELKAINIFLWATWGAFSIKILLFLILDGSQLSDMNAIAITISILVAWLLGLLVAWFHIRKAADLRRTVGIRWKGYSRLETIPGK